MNKKLILLVIIVLASVIFISGCTSTTPTGSVKSAGDVQKTVGDVSSDIENVQSALNDIDSKLK